MTQSRKPIEEIAEAVFGALPALNDELRSNLRGTLQAAFERLDLVTREELEVQEEVLRRTRDRLEALEERVRRMEESPPPTAGD
jgi:BMFP domain-containing protein YqiC